MLHGLTAPKRTDPHVASSHGHAHTNACARALSSASTLNLLHSITSSNSKQSFDDAAGLALLLRPYTAAREPVPQLGIVIEEPKRPDACEAAQALTTCRYCSRKLGTAFDTSRSTR
jgi:hypothetical protein